MSNPRKLYIASILGIGSRHGIPDTRHIPIILDAECIADTVKEACEVANKACPASQYPFRHVIVRPIPIEIITAKLLPIAHALVSSTSATEVAIQFQAESTQPLNSDDLVILEFDKPPA